MRTKCRRECRAECDRAGRCEWMSRPRPEAFELRHPTMIEGELFSGADEKRMAPRLIHKRPGPVDCENALERYATSELIARAGKRRLWVSRELRPMPTVRRISPYQEIHAYAIVGSRRKDDLAWTLPRRVVERKTRASRSPEK